MDTTYTIEDTSQIAHTLLASIVPGDKATIVGLSGDLGAGKTTLVQAMARELGVVEQVVSPTFVIAKFYETTDARFHRLIHVDAYRIEQESELETLGWYRMINVPQTLIVVEWPERVVESLPATTTLFRISHDGDQRHILHI
jgi:tRNA threonylcarbamoyladenosine biosynthesis protein TsaE